MDEPIYPTSRHGSALPPVRHANSTSSMKRHHSGSSDHRVERKRSNTKQENSSDGEGKALGKAELKMDTVNAVALSDAQDLEKLKRACTCGVCQELLFEPYFLQCGHVYCYHCILQWVKQAKNNRSRWCPHCRVVLTTQPAPAFMVREMVDVFVHRADVHSPTGAGLELKIQREEMAQMVKRDMEGKGLFDGVFKPKPPARAFVDLEDDGVHRCPRCLWEVHHGFCENPACGFRVQTGDFSDEDSEGEMIYDGVDRWAESALDTDNLTAGEEDEWEDEIDDDGLTDGDERHLHQEYDSDDEPVTRRARRRALASEESDEESDTGTEGSLADFVEHDTPGHYGIGPRPGGYIPDSTFNMGSSSPVSEQSQPSRRNPNPRARPIVIDDDDDDDDPSSMSEASMSRAGFRSARNAPIALSSDYEDEEGSSLLENGYQSLGNATASENEDEMVYRPRNARRRNMANTIPEVDETESEDMSEDTDGDIHMDEMPRPRNGPVNGTRSYGNRQTIDLDSASESEAALSPRGGRRGPQNGTQQSPADRSPRW